MAVAMHNENPTRFLLFVLFGSGFATDSSAVLCLRCSIRLGCGFGLLRSERPMCCPHCNSLWGLGGWVWVWMGRMKESLAKHHWPLVAIEHLTSRAIG